MPSTAVGTPDFEPSDARGITDLVAEHSQLLPLGDAELRGVCPFCASTAFRVRPEPRGTFHFFRCGEGGDAVRFATRIWQSR